MYLVNSLSLCFLVSIDFVFGHGFKEEKLTAHFSSPQLLNLFFLQMECTHSLLTIFSSLWNKSAGSFCSGFNCTLVLKCLTLLACLLHGWPLTYRLPINWFFFLLCCFVTDDSEICDLWRIHTVHCLERERKRKIWLQSNCHWMGHLGGKNREKEWEESTVFIYLVSSRKFKIEILTELNSWVWFPCFNGSCLQPMIAHLAAAVLCCCQTCCLQFRVFVLLFFKAWKCCS